MAESEATSGGRSNKNNLENALEALIGALYLDSNDLKQVALFVEKHWLPLILSMEAPPKDPKSTLQEWSQKLGKPIPAYNLIATTGLAHAPSFAVEVVVKGLPPISQTGPSKKVAERLAATKMLEYIKNHGIKG
jgi:ribonuclease-3